MSNIIESQVFSGELYIKASDYHRAVAAAVAAEREACAKAVEDYCGAWDDEGYALATAIRARGGK
jgi:hypothetical protein